MSVKSTLQQHRDAIIEAYQRGVSTCELGRAYQCSNASIWLFLKAEGVPLRQVKISEEQKHAVIALYQQGYSASAVSRELGITQTSANRILKRAGVDLSSRSSQREDPLGNHKEEIIDRYLSGQGSYTIAKAFGCHDASILERLRAWGIEIRNLRDYAYSVNQNFFDVIDNEVKAYVLGFWMADGCNRQHVPVISLSLTDEDILRRIAQELQWDGPVRQTPPCEKGRLPQYRICIGSRALSDALADKGCVAHKTYCATFPDDCQVPPHLQRHLIRGWHDGDGTLTCKPDERNWHARIVGTEAACRGMSGCIQQHLGFSGNLCPVLVGDTHTTWGFTVAAQADLRHYLEWLYRDATIYLERKFQKFLELPKPSASV